MWMSMTVALRTGLRCQMKMTLYFIEISIFVSIIAVFGGMVHAVTYLTNGASLIFASWSTSRTTPE